MDIFEKELLPFGLIRYGVAPDHQAMKRTANDMSQVGVQAGLRFIGGVNIVCLNLLQGRDIPVQFLEDKYSAIIYAYGASKEWQLPELKGNNVISSQDLIRWYNSHPSLHDFGKNHIKDWKNIYNVVIVG